MSRRDGMWKARRLAVTATLLLAMTVFAEIPQMISYQGRVTDAGGVPVADGSYTMRFRIYDDAVAGLQLWDSGDRSITLTGGVFSVLLGGSPQPALNLAFDEDYWLRVTFAGDDQTPRARVASAGYAYMASGLVPGTEVSGSITSGTYAAIRGTNTATTGFAFGLSGWSDSNSGSGVWGYASAASGSPNGVYGWSVSTAGNGVQGYVSSSSGATHGVYGWSQSSAGTGVYGLADAASGTTYGVYGSSVSTSGRGIYGYATATAGTTYGVYGRSASTAGMGVAGWALAVTGTTYGVYGRCDSTTDGRGVYGEATATTGVTYGVLGRNTSTAGRAVYGEATATTGYTYGGRFEAHSTSGRGVYCEATATAGLTYGGMFENASTSGHGVYSRAYAATGYTIGVFGSAASTDGYGVYYSGGLAGTGTKSCVVKTSQGPTLMYCQESPENWFEDVGRGELLNGRAHIDLDPLFLETVTIDPINPMNVFVQLRGDCRGVFVEEGLVGFDVIELQGGRSQVGFVYRVMAKRKGFEAKRLDVCEAARTDSYLYPELREKEQREREERRARHDEERARMEEERIRMEEEHTRREEGRGRMELDREELEPVLMSEAGP